MIRGKLSAQSAQKNRLALILAAAALVLAAVLLSLPVVQFTTSIYTKRSANTFVGDEKYIAAMAEAEAVLEQYADAGIGGSLKIDESVTERVNSKGETTSLVVLSVQHSVRRSGWDFLRSSLTPGRMMQALVLCVVLAAVLAGCQGIHTSVNGLGERAGNAPLASVQAILKDQFQAHTAIDESRLNEVSRLVESYSGIAIPPNQPITGENVFTQVAGVHADGDNKAGLYQNALLPERFGRRREYALGKNSGKANILRNLEELGLELTAEQTKRVTQRIIELGDKKELVTQEDLPFIVNDVLKHGTTEEHVRLLSYVVTTAYGLKPLASLRLEINGHTYEESAQGDGQFDAFVRAIRHIYKNKLGRRFPWLTNYSVSIPPGGRTDAFVQTSISWNWDNRVIRTRGFDADQTEAAIKATIKMLNLIEQDY